MSIKSIEGFISAIKEYEDGFTRFYRGQTDDWILSPNVFRDKFYEHESEIFNEIVNKKPSEFSTCRCAFDYLAKMQHYNIPTRLLDITSNPLIALYFALSDKLTKPTVYCIDIPTELVKNYNSDSVTILSNLARYNDSKKGELLDTISILNTIRDRFIQVLRNIEKTDVDLYFSSGAKDVKELDIFRTLELFLDSYIHPKSFSSSSGTSYFAIDYKANSYIKDSDHLAEFLQDLLHDLSDTPRWFWGNNDIFANQVEEGLDRHFSHIDNPMLLHEIRQDKPYFQDKMHIDTFNTIYCVKPRLENPRIIKQNGAFLIYPYVGVTLDNLIITKIHIDKSSAQDILRDLSRLDIDRGSLFDDMDSVSKSIKEKYRKT